MSLINVILGRCDKKVNKMIVIFDFEIILISSYSLINNHSIVPLILMRASRDDIEMEDK